MRRWPPPVRGHWGTDRRRLDAARRRRSAGHGPDEDREVDRLQALPGHRRARRRPPRAAVVGRMALSPAGRHLSPPARGRAHRLGDGDDRSRLRCRGAARDRGPAHRSMRGRDLLGRLPQAPAQARPEAREARRLLCPGGGDGGDRPRCRRDLATLRDPLDAADLGKAQQAMATAALRQAFQQPDQGRARQTWRHVADRLRRRWPKPGTLMDDSRDDVLASWRPGPAQDQAAVGEYARAADQAGEAPRRRGRRLSRRGLHQSPDGRGPARGQRRMADAPTAAWASQPRATC